MLTTFCPPNAPGFYAEWLNLSGAPTPWQAVVAHDAAYIEATDVGQRHSFQVSLPPIAGDDTLVSAAIRGFAGVPMPPEIAVPSAGFETVGADWVLGTDCDMLGVVYTTTNPHTGARCISITSQFQFGISTCGFFEQTIAGFQIGATYRVKLWWRSTGFSAGRNATVTLDATVIGAISGNSPAGAWQQFTCVDFVATSASHTLKVRQTPGSGSNAFTRAFDDVTIEAVPADGSLVPFYRLYGQDIDLPTWTVPNGTPVLMPERALTGVTATAIRDGGFEIGVRTLSGGFPRLDQIELDLTIRAYRERFGFVGGAGRVHSAA